MIIYPPLDKLMEKVDSRYTLVIAAAKRARQLTEKEDNKVDKPVIEAVKEIYDGSVVIASRTSASEMSQEMQEEDMETLLTAEEE